MGIEVLPPDVNESQVFFAPAAAAPAPSNGQSQGQPPLAGIRFGLAAIKGVGEVAVQSILAARQAGGKFRSLSDLCERMDNRAVNRRVIEADFRIAVGNIIPHHPAGWSGGAKAVLPGVAGEETVAKMHLFGSRYPALGVIDSAMRREMEAFAEQIHLDAILNVVLNRAGELVGAVSGHFIHAHRKGVALSKEVYGIPIPARADLVISSTSPVDFDFFQGDKGITSAEPAVKDGGEILCVSGCIEGISPAHPELVDYVGKLTNSQIWEKLEQGEIPDPLTAAEAIVINDIRDKMRITMATGGLSPQICQSMGLGHIEPDRLNAYLQQRLKENPQLTIGIMRQSAELFPYIGTE